MLVSSKEGVAVDGRLGFVWKSSNFLHDEKTMLNPAMMLIYLNSDNRFMSIGLKLQVDV